MTRVLTTFALTSQRTIVRVGERSGRDDARQRNAVDIGGNGIAIIAGPRVVEGRAILLDLARTLHGAGASVIRAGTWRPLESAHALHGLALDALDFLLETRDLTGAPVATEVLDPRDVERVAHLADLLVLGEASMQNRPLLAEVGRSGRPVVLERGLAATLDELLDAAEHIMAHGNPHVVLCERGIRTFEPRVPAALDISAIPLLRTLTHLPVIVAPGEACLRPDLIPPLVAGAIAAGADGVMLDVHADRGTSGMVRDCRGSLSSAAFADLVRHVQPFVSAAGRTLDAADPSTTLTDADGEDSTAPAAATGRQTPNELAALRSGIAQVDRRIIELIGQRVELARGAGKVKRDAGLPVIDEEQEHEVLARVRALAESAGLPYEELHALQAYLIEISRRAQTAPTHPSPRA